MPLSMTAVSTDEAAVEHFARAHGRQARERDPQHNPEDSAREANAAARAELEKVIEFRRTHFTEH